MSARLALLALALGACGARSELFALADARAPGDARDAAASAPDALDAAADAGCVGDADCDDAVRCTRDRCDRATGRCVHSARDAVCDDAVWCNGAERCDPTAGCVPAPARSCADAIECTRDACDEPFLRCNHIPDDALCPVSHRCDAVLGCVARALAHSRTALYEVLLPSGEVRLLARLIPSLTDLALAPDRTLYAVTTTELLRLDAATGDAVSVARIGMQFRALENAPDGGLYAAAGTTVYRLDRASGALLPVAAFPAGLESSGDLALLGGRLLGTARARVDAIDELVEFDAAAGGARVVGSVGFACVYGLAAFGATLYGLTCAGEVLRLDPANGRGTLLTRAPVAFFGAAAR